MTRTKKTILWSVGGAAATYALIGILANLPSNQPGRHVTAESATTQQSAVVGNSGLGSPTKNSGAPSDVEVRAARAAYCEALAEQPNAELGDVIPRATHLFDADSRVSPARREAVMSSVFAQWVNGSWGASDCSNVARESAQTIKAAAQLEYNLMMMIVAERLVGIGIRTGMGHLDDEHAVRGIADRVVACELYHTALAFPDASAVKLEYPNMVGVAAMFDATCDDDQAAVNADAPAMRKRIKQEEAHVRELLFHSQYPSEG
jgi:hypothetical protein